MQILEERLVLAATDVGNFLQCGHLSRLDLALARGVVGPRPQRPVEADLFARHGAAVAR